MTVHEAFQQAVEGGYDVKSLDGVGTQYSGANTEYSVWTRHDNDSSFMLRIEESLLDPAFWTCAFGQRAGSKRAHHLVDHLFAGGSIESFFRDCVRGSKGDQRRITDWFRRPPQRVQIYPLPEYGIS
jgi:hypothetical protein